MVLDRIGIGNSLYIIPIPITYLWVITNKRDIIFDLEVEGIVGIISNDPPLTDWYM